MRPASASVVAVAGFVVCLGVTIVSANPSGAGQGSSDTDRARLGLAFARQQGIPLDLRGRNVLRIGLGSYLVNAAGGCNDCHTAPPYTQDPYAYLGAPKQVNVPCYLAGGQAFGPFVSRDITPWENGKPAGLSFAEFVHVMRTGEDPDNPGQLLHVMPWPVYQELKTSDLQAIYAFLDAIPAIPANACGVPSEP